MTNLSHSPVHKRVRSVLAFLSLSACLGAGHAGLFEDEDARKAILDLRQRVQEIQQKYDELNRRSGDDGSQVRRGQLEFQNQLDAYRAEIAKLRGQNEQLTRDLAELQRQQRDLAQALDERLRKFEPFRVSADGKEFLVEPNEKRDFDSAMASVRKGDFAHAQQGLADLIARYPKTGYRQSALFWLGNAQYANREYKDALASFRAVLATGGDHPRLPEAMLAAANCQQELKDTKAARKTLEDLLAAYPGTEAAQAGKERLAKLR